MPRGRRRELGVSVPSGSAADLAFCAASWRFYKHSRDAAGTGGVIAPPQDANLGYSGAAPPGRLGRCHETVLDRAEESGVVLDVRQNPAEPEEAMRLP